MSDLPQPPSAERPAPSRGRPARTGRLVLGILLVLLGVGWLLEALDVADLPWEVVLSAALILVGAALLATSWRPRGHGALIATGVVLTVLLMVGSAIDIPLGGVGDRLYRPTSLDRIRAEYRLGIGRLTLDLTDLSGSWYGEVPRRAKARVGIGQLVVIVPEAATIRIRAKAGLGSVSVFGQEEGGFGAERTASPPDTAILDLDLSVGLGEVEVHRG